MQTQRDDEHRVGQKDHPPTYLNDIGPIKAIYTIHAEDTLLV